MSFDIPADRRAPLTARRKVAATLDSWGLEVLRADAELIVSELMSNAVAHAPGAGSHQLQIIRLATGVRLVVADDSTAVPTIRRDDGRPGGRGLLIIAALAVRWGHDVHGDGKHVWADVDQPETPRASRPAVGGA